MSKSAQSQYGGLPDSSSAKDTTSLAYSFLPSESTNTKSTNNTTPTNNNLSPSPTQNKRTSTESTKSPVSQYGGLPEPLAPTAPIHISQYGGLTEHVMPYGGMPNPEASKEVAIQYGGLPDTNPSTNNSSNGSDHTQTKSTSAQSYGGLPGNDPLAQYRGLPPAAPVTHYGGLPSSSKPMSPSTSSKHQQEFRNKMQQQQVELIATQSKNHSAYLPTEEMEEMLKLAAQQQ